MPLAGKTKHSTKRLLILGGTAEASLLAARFKAHPDIHVTLSLAGLTSRPVSCEADAVRSGGFGGATGLGDFLQSEAIDLVIDATHPFASMISRNAQAAAERVHVSRLSLKREPWRSVDGDRWHPSSSIEEGVRVLEALGARIIFAPLGARDVGRLRDADMALQWILRSIEPPLWVPRSAIVLQGRPPWRVEEEVALLRRWNVDHLIAKNSGSELVYAKIAAARELDLPVVMISPPAGLPGEVFTDVGELVAHALQLLGLAGRRACV